MTTDLAARLPPAARGEVPVAVRDTRDLVPDATDPLRAAHVYAEVAQRLPAESTVLAENPSTCGPLPDLMPARAPFGLRRDRSGGPRVSHPRSHRHPDGNARPSGRRHGRDGASLHGIQPLWTAAHYRVGALFVILHNGGYAVMARLASLQGGASPWPGFDEIDPAAIARGFGCPARTITGHGELLAVLDEVMSTLAERTEPLLLDVHVEPWSRTILVTTSMAKEWLAKPLLTPDQEALRDTVSDIARR